MNPILASSLPAKKFVDPDNYCTPFHGKCCIHYINNFCIYKVTFYRGGITAGITSIKR